MPDPPTNSQSIGPSPETWLPVRRAAMALVRPVEQFMRVEAASGILLLAAAVLALAWANSPVSASYEALLHTPVTIGIGDWTFAKSVQFWINDFLMAVFFLLVGLEIKREIVLGALSDLKSAALPVAAAVGGMLVPAGIYASLNVGTPGADGWGVPMATDIAFAVGVLTLLGRRVPAALRVLLLAFAIIDDLGAILVIAVFYSEAIDPAGLAVAASGILLLVLLLRLGLRPGLGFVLPLIVIVGGLYRAGIHPTIGGVIFGLAMPARAWFGREGFLTASQDAVRKFQERHQAGASDHELMEPLGEVAIALREALPPVVRLENALHPWVAYGIMPVFALANAGVDFGMLELGAPGAGRVLLGVGLGLLLGKPLGMLIASWIGVRAGLCVLPPGVDWRGMLVVGLAAGIGFTMAIFIAELAFAEPALLGVAKVGILGATLVAGVAAFLLGRRLPSREMPDEVGQATES